MSDPPAIVLDNGSGRCKIGFAEEDVPRTVFPSIVGRPRKGVKVAEDEARSYYIGYDAQENRDILTLDYPIQHGIVCNWDDMEKIWNHAFETLQASPEERPLLVSEAPLNPRANREKMTQVLFENYNVPKLYIANQAVLSDHACGRHTAVIVHSGDGVSHVTCIYEGKVIVESMQRMDLGGRDLTHYLMKLLMDQGYSFSTTCERDIVRDIKEKLCFVVHNLQNPAPGTMPDKYELPNGETINLGKLRSLCPESLFQPSLMGLESKGLHEATYDSLMKSGIDTRSDLYVNIILSGGNTMFPGFPERMHKMLSSLLPSRAKMRIVARNERQYYVWIGGSIMASYSSIKNVWITKHDYEEVGPSITLRNCF